MKNTELFPSVLYHGTDAAEKLLEKGFCKDEMVFLTDSRMAAADFGKKVLKCTCLLVQNSLRINAGGQSWGGLFFEDAPWWEDAMAFAIRESGGNPEDPEDEEYLYFHDTGLTVNFLAEFFFEQGYDLLILEGTLEDSGRYMNQYVAKSGRQVRIDGLLRKENCPEISRILKDAYHWNAKAARKMGHSIPPFRMGIAQVKRIAMNLYNQNYAGNLLAAKELVEEFCCPFWDLAGVLEHCSPERPVTDTDICTLYNENPFYTFTSWRALVEANAEEASGAWTEEECREMTGKTIYRFPKSGYYIQYAPHWE